MQLRRTSSPPIEPRVRDPTVSSGFVSRIGASGSSSARLPAAGGSHFLSDVFPQSSNSALLSLVAGESLSDMPNCSDIARFVVPSWAQSAM